MSKEMSEIRYANAISCWEPYKYLGRHLYSPKYVKSEEKLNPSLLLKNKNSFKKFKCFEESK